MKTRCQSRSTESAELPEQSPDEQRRVRRTKAAAQRLLKQREFILILLNLIFIAIMATLEPRFLSRANFRVMLVGSGLEFVLVAAMAFLLIGKMFDLSIDGVVNMVGVITGLLLVAGVPVAIAVIAGLSTGAVVGLINGFAVTKMRMNPLMTTLATWWAAQGIAYGLIRGISPSRFPDSFVALGASAPLGVPIPIWYGVLLTGLAIWVLRKTRFGYHTYATGGDRVAARLRGVHVDRVTIIGFLASALASGLTGLVYAARLNASTPIAANGVNLRIVAAAVIGGCSLSGGRGSVVGASLGLMFMTMLLNATIVLRIDPLWQYTVLGLVVFVAVAADALTSARKP